MKAPYCAVVRDSRSRHWRCMTEPKRVVAAHTPAEVMPALQRIEKAVETEDMHAAGWIAYEAAAAFDPALQTRSDSEHFPLLWFALSDQLPACNQLPPRQLTEIPSFPWRPSISDTDYKQGFRTIRKCIEKGETYQVNYTHRLHAACTVQPWQLFLALAEAQDPPFAAYIESNDWAVCSASPELFFTLDGHHIESRPMKGTAGRGRWYEEDCDRASWLSESEKNRAENLMIVDMVRNDIGRIAEPGTVRVPNLFAVEKYPTVWQMTSTVAASTKQPITQILAALFPPASITGAPKCRTMQIITEQETTPRRVYTGAVGFIGPGRQVHFNVAIRTLLVDRRKERAEYGVGGGVVWDSNCAGEREECRIKAQILYRSKPDFDVLETMLWTPEDGIFLLDYHMKRLVQSAEYFAFPLDIQRIRTELQTRCAKFAKERQRLRLTVNRRGVPDISNRPLNATEAGFPNLALASEPVDSKEPMLYHKTTARGIYDRARSSRPGFADVLLYNESGHVTESTMANVVIDTGRHLVTPPIHCGLLPGTYRQYLLDQGRVHAEEITVEEVKQARHMYLINSVRGMHEVELLT